MLPFSVKKWFLLPQMTTFAHSPLNPTNLPYFTPLPPTILHFPPHLKDVSKQVKGNRVSLRKKLREIAVVRIAQNRYRWLCFLSAGTTSFWGIDSPSFRCPVLERLLVACSL